MENCVEIIKGLVVIKQPSSARNAGGRAIFKIECTKEEAVELAKQLIIALEIDFKD